MDALKVLTDDKNIALFEKYGVFRRREMISRYDVFMEDYHRKVKIEGEVALEIAQSMIVPAAAAEYGRLLHTLRDAGTNGLPGVESLRKRAALLGEKLDRLAEEEDRLAEALHSKHEEILAALARIRVTVDALEKIVPDDCWPLPKYREMLFIY